MAQQDTMTATMVTGDDDNDVDDDGTTGKEVVDDGDDGDGDDVMGSVATGYDNDDNGDGRQR